MANSVCSVKTSAISSAFISKEGNEILSAIKAPRYVDYINYLFGNVFKREYLDNDSYVTLSDFTDDNNKFTVGGNLNNLYSKVKEELVNQINSDFMLTLPDKDLVANELISILENWKLFVDFHSKYNAYIAVRPEDLEEDEEKDYNNYDKSGNEHTEFSLLTNEVRTAFKFLPKTQLGRDSSGKIVGTPIVSPVDGLPLRSDFENIFKLTLDALKGIKDEAKFIERLTSEEVLYRIPELYFLFELLPVNNGTGTANLTNKQRRLFHQFFQVMSRDYIPVYASTVTKEDNKLPSHIRYAAAKSNINKIEKQFISNFISNQEVTDYVIIDNTIDDKNPENSVFGRKRLVALPKKLPLIDLSSDAINALSVRKIKSEYKPYFDFYKILGVEFSDFSLLSDKRALIKVLNHTLTIHDNLSERLKRNIKIFNPLEDLKSIVKYVDQDKKQKTINQLRNILKDILKFEGSISKISPTLVTKAANGENQSDITYSNAISISAQQINSVSSLDELYEKPYFKKLKYNPLHKNSYIGTKVVGNTNVEYQIENYSGYTVVENEDSYSSDTKSLTDSAKFKSDFNNLMAWATINTPQLESKAGYFAIKFIDKNTGRSILPFPENLFTKDFITESEFTAQILHYLNGEIERVKSYPKVKGYAPSAYGEFHIFKNFVSPEIKEDLLKDVNSAEYKRSVGVVLSKINKYFNDELNHLKGFIQKNNITNYISQQVLQRFGINEQAFNENKAEYEDTLLRTFIANDFVHNIEFGIYVSGDPLFYKDYHKRLGGLSSTGTQPIATNNIKSLFASDQEKIFWDTFSLRGILNQVSSEAKQAERRDNSETFLSAVLKEDNVKENTEYQKQSTIDNYIYSVKLNTGKDITEEQAKKDLKIDQISKKGIDVGDGQGYLNLDAARELSIKQGTYRPQQDVSYKFEALIFKQLLLEEKGKTLDEAETKLLKKLEGQIFRDPDKYALPTLKQTYYGTISNESVEIDAKIFDKFSLAILLPSTARKHPKLKNLLLAMAKRQIHYVKYQSGTKGFIRDIFNNAEEIGNENNELDELQTSLLKLQITPSKTEKTSTKIPTQKLKLLFTNLFDKGEASESVIKLRNKFLNDLSAIKDFNRKNVLRKLGFTVSDIDGKIINWDKEKVINALVSQVNLQKLPTPLLEALETDENGDFLNTIESSNIYQQVLNYVTGKLDSTLREFKVNGGDFVLLSESMFERPLNYFRLNEGRTETLGCDCRITMTKEYAKMLNLPDFEDKSKKIGSITRMNELLLIPEFREKYKKELTIVFSRPPVQGPNSMGFATITEFFYPTAGNILQLPKEFMHQAGIDFDYDKEKVLIPSLTNDGIYINKENLKKRKETLEQSDTYKSLYQEGQDAQKIYDYLDIELDDYESEEEFNKAKEAMLQEDNILKFLLNLFPTNKEEVEKNLQDITKDIVEYINVKNAQKSILSNNLLESMRGSLKQPEIYSELILPNTDSTVKPLALSNGKDINNLNTLPSGIDVYSYMQNLKVFKLFNDAKALLGPFALHNVFMELIAPLNIVANLDYNYNEKGEPTKRVNLLLSKDNSRTRNISTRYDENGNIKQHITSEFINATVDSAKDPYFANFMLSFDNINTFTFLMALNYPVETIVDFTSSAVVRKYLDLKNKNKDLPKEVIAKIILSEISPRPLKGTVGMNEIIETDESFIGIDNTELLSKLKEFKSDESLENKDNFKYLAAILCNFIAMEEHSKQFSNFKNLFKNDTNKTSSLYEISSKKSLRNTVTSAGMFTSESVSKVEGNSTMTAFRNDDLIAEVLSNVFPIMSDPIVFKGLGNLFNESKAGLKPVDKRILSQIITNDYITSILYSYGEYNGENFFTYGRKLVSKNKQEDGTLNTTLLERIYKLKQHKSYPDLVKIFPVLDKILGEVSSKPLKGNLVYRDKFGFNVLLNIDPNIPILEKEDYMRQFKQIVDEDFTLENQMIKTALVGLVKDFFVAGLMQSGFNKSGISFIEYAPVKFIQSLLNPALDKYNLLVKNNSEGLEKYVNRFRTIFTLNNAKYFFIDKSIRKYIVKHSHLGKYLYTAEAPTGTYTAPAKPALPLPSLPEITATNPKDFVNHSGGAYGGDTLWDIVGRKFGVTEHKHYREENNQNLSKRLKSSGVKATVITKDQLEKARQEIKNILGISYPDTLQGNLQVRNYYQVANADAVFAIAKLANSVDKTKPDNTIDSNKSVKSYIFNKVTGGTNTAVQLGIKLNKPVYVWDITTEKWYKFIDTEFKEVETPTLTKNFAGVGSRDIENYNVLNKETNKWESRKEYIGDEKAKKAEQAIEEVYSKTFPKIVEVNLKETPTIEVKSINIYSTDKNGFESLSNMAIRPFRYNFGASYTDFNSVEQAYQAAKYQYTDQSAANQKVEDAILESNNPFEIKQLGRKFSKLDRKEWDKNSSRIMKDFIKESFRQNPKALAKLLSTGDAILTHTQDSTKWKTEFPKLLMEVRDELSGEPISENPVIETSVIEELQSSLEDNKKVFTYKGVTIDTEFVLGEQQKEALEALIDFADSNKTFMTLQGAAGTGKTTIIGYLQKYLKNKASFAYMAPTHAATAELAFATVKTGSNILPSTLQSAITLNSKTKKHVFTQKIQKRVGYNPIFILDEASMIDKTDIDKIKEALDDFGGKVIFLGDEKQISKVTQSNDKTKPVSPAFTSFDQVRLTKIYRQSDNSLLNLLSAMREQTDFKLFKVENSDIVKFVNKKEFNQELVKDLGKDPENTVVVTYTNNSVKGTNINIRSVLGRTGQTVVNDIVVGYLGYASKQIEKGDIANSISYIITNIEKDGSKRTITARSSKLTRLIDSGIGGISDVASTVYYQLNADDSLTFDDLTQLDYEQNNRAVAKVFKQLYEAGLAYSNKEISYQTYLMILAGINDTLRQYSVGNDYIYNPATDKMERYDAIKHKALKTNGQGSLLFSKDIDYGHAITIHKSQGATIDNVYFDASSLNAARNIPIVDENNNQITTEKMSLAYVAMSRSKKKLVVYEGDNTFELLKNEKNDVSLQNNKDLNDIGFKKTCE